MRGSTLIAAACCFGAFLSSCATGDFRLVREIIRTSQGSGSFEEIVEFSYDGAGRLVEKLRVGPTDRSVTRYFYRDDSPNPWKSAVVSYDSEDAVTEYRYDAAGNLSSTEIRFVAGGGITETYGSDGRPATIETIQPNGAVTYGTYEYFEDGETTTRQITYDSGLVHQYVYDSDGIEIAERIVPSTGPAASTRSSGVNEYDRHGNLVRYVWRAQFGTYVHMYEYERY